jgi:hypothetical protein
MQADFGFLIACILSLIVSCFSVRSRISFLLHFTSNQVIFACDLILERSSVPLLEADMICFYLIPEAVDMYACLPVTASYLLQTTISVVLSPGHFSNFFQEHPVQYMKKT